MERKEKRTRRTLASTGKILFLGSNLPIVVKPKSWKKVAYSHREFIQFTLTASPLSEMAPLEFNIERWQSQRRCSALKTTFGGQPWRCSLRGKDFRAGKALTVRKILPPHRMVWYGSSLPQKAEELNPLQVRKYLPSFGRSKTKPRYQKL